MAVTNVVNRIWRNWKSILAILLLRRSLHHTLYTLNNVIHISEITLTISIIENLNRLALQQLIGKSKVRHVRSARRTIHRKET